METADGMGNGLEGALRFVTGLGAAAEAIRAVQGVPVVVLPDGDGAWRTDVIDLERYQPHPRRKTGSPVVRDVASFIEYVNRHKTEATLAWADSGGWMRCVLNDHEGAILEGAGLDDGAAGWQDHTVTMRRERTRGFEAWWSHNGKWLTQQEFAEFLEDRIPEIHAPAGADLLEIATFFQANTAVNFTSARQLSNGQVQMQYVEKIEESGGRNGDTKVPTEFTLVLRPYMDALKAEDGKPEPNQFVAAAKLRYRLEQGKVKFMFKLSEDFLVQLDGIHQAAIAHVREETGVPVLLSAGA